MAALVGSGCGENATPKPAPPFTPDPALQAQRKELIDVAIEEGYVQKIEKPWQVPHVWVTPLFMQINFEDKAKFCSAVYSYHFPNPNESEKYISLYHSISGKEVGTYSPTYGLSLD